MNSPYIIRRNCFVGVTGLGFMFVPGLKGWVGVNSGDLFEIAGVLFKVIRPTKRSHILETSWAAFKPIRTVSELLCEVVDVSGVNALELQKFVPKIRACSKVGKRASLDARFVVSRVIDRLSQEDGVGRCVAHSDSAYVKRTNYPKRPRL